MSDGIWAALSGAVAQQRSLDVTANNVANANTAGFRADRLVFEQALSQAGTDGPAPDAVRFVETAEMVTDHRAGALQQTGNPLDLALEGDGWFSVQTPSGERFTRAGAFVTNADGLIVTADGHPLLGVQEGDGPPPTLRLPPDASSIRVADDGTVYANERPIGRIRLTRFSEQPRKEGLTLYVGGQGAEPADARVRQGYLEMANVNAVAGMNELITVTRSFEAFQKVIDTFQALDERTARDLGARGR